MSAAAFRFMDAFFSPSARITWRVTQDRQSQRGNWAIHQTITLSYMYINCEWKADLDTFEGKRWNILNACNTSLTTDQLVSYYKLCFHCYYFPIFRGINHNNTQLYKNCTTRSLKSTFTVPIPLRHFPWVYISIIIININGSHLQVHNKVWESISYCGNKWYLG